MRNRGHRSSDGHPLAQRPASADNDGNDEDSLVHIVIHSCGWTAVPALERTGDGCPGRTRDGHFAKDDVVVSELARCPASSLSCLAPSRVETALPEANSFISECQPFRNIQ